jgi:hypothetical protein
MSEARKLYLSPLEKLVPFDVMRSFDENESRVVAIAAGWEFLPTYAGYLVLLYMCWIVDNPVDSGLFTNVCRLEDFASACGHVLLLVRGSALRSQQCYAASTTSDNQATRTARPVLKKTSADRKDPQLAYPEQTRKSVFPNAIFDI